ncbi:pyruvate dehydrogenase (acetyl-transferring) kinase, mitochondrial isoform X2 [Odontomachus brunneus]|uniref:pyruvate dehydrogenase (acetyl-transferring) kinase, mitochondrial isoform X2 n=1 Tax=Odontomachus brunneus TaxID=486640 RepID=UPI0013F1BEBE|nr:pyruvate dehydrogenase (acetyl-transferring) kinase, mitochondrial isoform X2 [Odontomachus brunneus]XP_032691441.1 pyruvate dehydrogenase (acetyl-transferring) kinase, mitochondrial isoform X2 [Odontomachus brunneus]XP_032691442.1 pyruvate dehydrogenase (acetyl-transferring) kinase, mitochondrial isoform X2 [Odontomachus brunneus]
MCLSKKYSCITHYQKMFRRRLFISIFCISACERKSFIFLRKELPVRLANIMKEIHLLPDNLLKMPSVGIVNNLYATSFEEIIHFEKVEINHNNLYKFCQALIKIRNRHTDVVQTMAQGVLELKESHDVDVQTENSIQYFLDRFFMSRISIRMLINQHTLLFGGLNGHNRHVGCIDPSCDVIGVIKDAYENARFLCDQYYMASPELIIKQHNELERSSEIRIIYVPSHLYHMLFELFKNSMRAVMEHHGEGSDNYPPVEVMLVRGKEDICVKISDRGGGIPRSETDHLFKYMYSTAPQPSRSDAHTVPLAGYGYGLPLSRLYARYLHGDIVLLSCEGYGTDAIIYLKALSTEANELLPIFNKTSSKFYRTPVPTADWSSQCGGGMATRQLSVSHVQNHRLPHGMQGSHS